MHSKLLLLSLLIISCSSNKDVGKVIDLNSCHLDSDSVDNRAMIANINSKLNKLSPCLKNYLKFSKIDDFSFSGCVRLVVSKSGQVNRVSLYPSNLPKDLSMCVEQELRFFNFKDLHLTKKQNLSFPIHFSK